MPVNNNIITAPVDIVRDLGNYFGVSGGDLGRIIDLAPINKWSKVKPVRHTSWGVAPGAPVLALMKEANYGFGGNAMFSNVDTTVIFNTAINNGCDWNYLRPDGIANNHPYRTLDFDGYNHSNATPPVSITFGEVSGNTPKRLYCNFTVSSTAQLKLLDFSFADLSSFDSSSNDFNYKYALLYRLHGGSGAPSIVTGINVFKYENGVISYNHGGSGGGYGPNDIIYLNAPTVSQTTLYDVVPCIIRYSSVTGNYGNCIYLPSGEIFLFDAYSGSTGTGITDFTITSKQNLVSPTQAEMEAGTGMFKVIIGATFNLERAQESGYIPFKARVKFNNVWGEYSTSQSREGEYVGQHSESFYFGYSDYPGIPAPVGRFASGPVWLEISVNGIPVLDNYLLTTII